VQPSREIGGDAGVKDAMIPVCEDVDSWLHAYDGDPELSRKGSLPHGGLLRSGPFTAPPC
jgi:hypothetical protein